MLCPKLVTAGSRDTSSQPPQPSCLTPHTICSRTLCKLSLQQQAAGSSSFAGLVRLLHPKQTEMLAWAAAAPATIRPMHGSIAADTPATTGQSQTRMLYT